VGRSHLRVFDDATFDLLASHPLGPQEIPTSITSMAFSSRAGGDGSGGDAGADSSGGAGLPGGSRGQEEPQQYFIVGTAIIKPNVSGDAAVLLCCCAAAVPEPAGH
jgi:hypothetical protein